MSILLLSKTTEWCRAAQRFVVANEPGATIVEGERTDPLPDRVRAWSGDLIVSFLGPWVVPPAVLARAARAAINFHPGPPEYPGIGCYNFALYDGAGEYGVTCHHMEPSVDSGPIVRVVRFKTFPTDTVATLKERSVTHLLTMFYDVMTRVFAGADLPRADIRWSRKPYTRRELDALCRITPDMSAAEVDRRVRATTFPGAPGPVHEGHRPAKR